MAATYLKHLDSAWLRYYYASKLGPNRALFSSEEQARLEKFRPFGLPAEDWLEDARERLRRRAGG